MQGKKQGCLYLKSVTNTYHLTASGFKSSEVQWCVDR